MAVDPARLRLEILADPCGFQLRQLFLAGQYAALLVALNRRRFALLPDGKWAEATRELRGALAEYDNIAALVTALSPPSRAEQIWGDGTTVTAGDLSAAMG